jgi:hypothetical protein
MLLADSKIDRTNNTAVKTTQRSKQHSVQKTQRSKDTAVKVEHKDQFVG